MSTASFTDSALDASNVIGNIIAGLQDHVIAFCSAVLDLHAVASDANEVSDTVSAQAIATADVAVAQSSFVQTARRIKHQFHRSLSELFAELHRINRTFQPNSPLLSRLRSVEYWDKNMEVSF